MVHVITQSEMTSADHADNRDQTEALRLRLAEAEEMLRAIRQGEIDALVVEGARGNQVYTLHNADEPYRDLVEQMHEGAVVLTDRGDILYANARFASLVGAPLASVIGSRFDRFVSASEREDLETLLAAGSGRRRCELLGPDAGPFEVSLSLTTTISPEGLRRNLVVTDLKELLEAQSSRDRAERDNRTKDGFLTMLAHELRNPLGVISTAVKTLKMAQGKGGGATGAHDLIARQVGNVTRLIDDLLDIERVVSGKIRLNREQVDFADLVRRIVATFVADAGLDRQIDVRSEPAWINGDAVRIEQVLTNILTNAVKYTPPGGRIRVGLRADGAEAVLSVEDTGFGIAPSLLPFIFDMYVQADETVGRARGGLGIGLALVRRLVEVHGGTVTAASDGEGKGSSFTVRLKAIPLAEVSPGVSFLGNRRAKARRVLLIEDSGTARERLRMMLELAGHVVYEAADGVRGIELLNAVRPHVAIIDVSLPGMDGYHVAMRIREKPQGRGMLLLALTGRGAPVDSRHSLQRGFDRHLVKPVDPEYLARLIGEGVEAT